MILVRNIGISGYVPLECVVGLSHALVRYRLDKCEYSYKSGFEYLGVSEIDKTYNLDILRNVVSFAIVRRCDDCVRSAIIHDVGLSFGYYCAGVVFPNKLRNVLRDIMGLSEYHILPRPSHHPSFSSLRFVYISAWYEYICLDPDTSYVCSPPIFIRILGSKNPFPTFLFNGLPRILSR
jgi:hypothetical protein